MPKIMLNNREYGGGGGSGDTTQYSIMPVASASNVNQIIQYTGATNQNYTNGYFYKCIFNDPDYEWENINVNANNDGGSDLGLVVKNGKLCCRYAVEEP